jgi:hypothetical protein
MSDSGLSDIRLSCFIIGFIRFRIEGLQSDKFFSDIGQGNTDVGYRTSATKIFDVAPTYGYDSVFCSIVRSCNAAAMLYSLE